MTLHAWTISRLSSRLVRTDWLLLLAVLCLLTTNGYADGPMAPSRGQTVYVPAYSHIYSGDREQPIYLTVTLSVRNTDPAHPITITRAEYYDSDGRLIKRYVESPQVIKAMAAARYVIKESDKVGGSGASFLVSWRADRAVNPALIETVMISSRHTLGISFTSRGQVIHTASP